MPHAHVEAGASDPVTSELVRAADKLERGLKQAAEIGLAHLEIAGSVNRWEAILTAIRAALATPSSVQAGEQVCAPAGARAVEGSWFVCIDPSGRPFWPSVGDTREESLRICFGNYTERHLSERLDKGWRCEPFTLSAAPATPEPAAGGDAAPLSLSRIKDTISYFSHCCQDGSVSIPRHRLLEWREGIRAAMAGTEARSTLSASTADGETAGDGLSLTALHAANIARQAEWCPDQVPDLSFRGNELAGETGEACNVIKKLERERQGWRGSRASKADLAEELADVVICADLCAVTAGIDLSAAVIAKFNGASEKQGLSTRLPTPTRPDATAEEGR